MKEIELLMVEDNEGDIDLAQIAFEEFKLPHKLHICEDGEIALNYVTQEVLSGKAPRPDVILLDLNLPKVSGQAVLQTIKSNPNLKEIPVFIFSTSASESEITKASAYHKTWCYTKPFSFKDYGIIIESIRKVGEQN